MVGKIEDVIFQRPEIDRRYDGGAGGDFDSFRYRHGDDRKDYRPSPESIKAEKLDTPEKVMEQIKKIISELIAKDAGYALSSSTPLVLLS